MGTIRERNGRYEYRFSYRDACGVSRRKSISGYSEEECLEKYEKFLSTVKLDDISRNTNITIADILRTRYRNDFAKNYITESTYNYKLELLRIIERDVISRKPVRKLTEQDIDRFLLGITAYSDSVVKKVYGMIRSALMTAIEHSIIEVNPLRETYRRPRSVSRIRKVSALTEEEQIVFEETLSNYKVPRNRNNYKPQLLIELHSGLRMGEINALMRDDIDLDSGYIHINKTICRGIDYRPYIKESSKSDKGTRSVPIVTCLRPILEEALENAPDNPLGLVFFDENKNDIISTKQVNDFFYRVLDKAGIERRGQHSLRHTFATRAIEAGVNSLTLKEWLGHQDIHETLDTYADVFARLSRDSIGKVEDGLRRENYEKEE